MIFNLLYIDPGTGSALFSILIGAAATLFFLGRALWIKIKVFISGGRIHITESSKNPYVIYNEGKQYSNLFLPILDEFETRKIKIKYFTSDPEDPLFKNKYNSVDLEYIGEGNRAYSRLNLLNADVVLMTTPGLGVYQLKRSKGVRHYSHILHAPSDATMYRLFGIDYFDSVLLTGDYQAADIRILEQQRGINKKQLVTVGCTYLDVYSDKLKHIPVKEKEQFTVLVSPSWGSSAILSRYGEKLLNPLLDTGFHITIRPHPQSKKSESSLLEKFTLKYQNSKNLEWDYERENLYSMAKSDIMISDFSGIIFDYSFLFDKPVIYINSGFDIRPYDADDLGENATDSLWQFKTLREIGIELKEEDFPKIGSLIRNVSDNEQLRIARKNAKSSAWQYQGQAAKKVVDFLVSTLEITV